MHPRQRIDTFVTGSLAAGARRVPVLLLAAIFAWPAAALAQSSNAASRFHQYESQQAFVPAFVPLGLKGGGRVKVVVVMAADSVAAARARVPDRALTTDEKRAVENLVAADHRRIEPEITSRGGHVLTRFHHALNGIKIEIDRNQVAQLAALPGVVEVLPVLKHRKNNAVSVPFIGAPIVWQGTPGFRGEGVKIAIIDTGIDYTHANFGGPGTVADFQAAAAASTGPANPALFGPNAPKVKGGTDLVGDAYDAGADPGSPALIPHPDPNPLDCNGHGSHVAGTAAGFGVRNDGTTYAGPYDSAAYQSGFRIGPGVAPKADIYSVRVFGCNGSTDVVTEAIDWAVQNDMDVISMSLGADFVTAKSADALAAQNAARAGIIVVAAAGNAGPAPYITGSPASGEGVISVAAVDSSASFPAAVITLAARTSITAIDANGAALPGGDFPVFTLRAPGGGVSLGCDEAEYVDASIAGKLVVTLRGTCARTDRAVFGQRHGAAAVAMINNGPGYPPFEGDIPGVTVPFLGVLTSDAPTLTGSTPASLASGTLANPTFRATADFSSGGPRFGDSHLKPNTAAPGVSILSTFSGSGNQGERLSGT
jgi:subtilisin family serine protease